MNDGGCVYDTDELISQPVPTLSCEPSCESSMPIAVIIVIRSADGNVIPTRLEGEREDDKIWKLPKEIREEIGCALSENDGDRRCLSTASACKSVSLIPHRTNSRPTDHRLRPSKEIASGCVFDRPVDDAVTRPGRHSPPLFVLRPSTRAAPPWPFRRPPTVPSSRSRNPARIDDWSLSRSFCSRERTRVHALKK